MAWQSFVVALILVLSNAIHIFFALSLKYYLINIVLCTIWLIEHLSLFKRKTKCPQTGEQRTNNNTERLKDQNEIGFSSNKSGLYFLFFTV